MADEHQFTLHLEASGEVTRARPHDGPALGADDEAHEAPEGTP